MIGRPRKPTPMKKLTGTLQPCRTNPDELHLENAAPAAPYFALSERGTELFHQICSWLTSMQIAATVYVANITHLALLLEQVEILTAIIRREGHTCKELKWVEMPKVVTIYSDDGKPPKTGGLMEQIIVRPRPEVSMRFEAIRRAQSLLGEFGLSASTVSKVAKSKSQPDPVAGWAALVN
jgi:hypothetical protein